MQKKLQACEQKTLSASGVAHFQFYQTTGNLASLERALANWQADIAEMSQDGTRMIAYLIMLSYGLSKRYEHTHNVADLDQAVQLLERAASVAIAGSPAYVQCLNN